MEPCKTRKRLANLNNSAHQPFSDPEDGKTNGNTAGPCLELQQETQQLRLAQLRHQVQGRGALRRSLGLLIWFFTGIAV